MRLGTESGVRRRIKAGRPYLGTLLSQKNKKQLIIQIESARGGSTIRGARQMIGGQEKGLGKERGKTKSEASQF